METIEIQGKEFTIGKLKGKHLRKMAKVDKDDPLKMIEIILDVDAAFVDEMDAEEIELVPEVLERVNPSMKKER